MRYREMLIPRASASPLIFSTSSVVALSVMRASYCMRAL